MGNGEGGGGGAGLEASLGGGRAGIRAERTHPWLGATPCTLHWMAACGGQWGVGHTAVTRCVGSPVAGSTTSFGRSRVLIASTLPSLTLAVLE